MRVEPNRYEFPQSDPNAAQPGRTPAGSRPPPGQPTPELSPAVTALLYGRTQQSDIRAGFQAQFAAAARDRDGFHSLLNASFGNGYDRQAAETIRRQALAGDWSWLPKIRFVSADTLQGANGAYDSESRTVLLNADRKADTRLMAGTLAHEVGHHLDTVLNRRDTVGEEGEMFGRLLGGEKLTRLERAEIRADEGRGTVRLDGKLVAVEFWNPIKSLTKAVRKAASRAVDTAGHVLRTAGKTIASATRAVAASGAVAASVAFETARAGVASAGRAVTDAVVRSARSISNLAQDLGSRISAASMIMASSLWDVTGRTFGHLFRGRFSEALSHFVRGADNLVLRLPGRVIDTTLDLQATAVQAAVHLIPIRPVRRAVAGFAARISDAGRSLGMGAYDTMVGVVRGAYEAASGVVRGLRQCAFGDFRGGLTRLGKSLLWPTQNAAERALMLLGKTASAVQTVA